MLPKLALLKPAATTPIAPTIRNAPPKGAAWLSHWRVSAFSMNCAPPGGQSAPTK